MNYHFTFRNMTFSNNLENYVKDRFGELFDKFGKNPINCYVTVESERKSRIVRCDLSAANSNFHAEHSSENFYESIDRSMDKLARQLRKHKKKLKPSSKVITDRLKRIDSLFDAKPEPVSIDSEGVYGQFQNFNELMFENDSDHYLKNM